MVSLRSAVGVTRGTGQLFMSDWHSPPATIAKSEKKSSATVADPRLEGTEPEISVSMA